MLEHVFMIFFILFSAIILSRGISRFAAIYPAWRTAGWLAAIVASHSVGLTLDHLARALSHIIVHYEIIVNKLGAQKTQLSH